MTTFTNNLNEQLFQKLDDEIAATLSGGAAVLYEHGDGGGRSPQFFEGTKNLGNYNFNDKTSAIYISKDQRWAFYKDDEYRSYLTSLEGGNNGRFYDYYDLIERGIPNDSITSLRKTAG
jgi:hypothetical protein